MKARYSYLRPFVGDWATKECLRDHLSGQRSYKRRGGVAEEDDGSSDFGNIRIGSEPDDNEDADGSGDGNSDEEIEDN